MKEDMFNKEISFISRYNFYLKMYDEKLLTREELERVKKILVRKYKPPISTLIT